MGYKNLVISFLLTALATAWAQEEAIVETAAGKIKGLKVATKTQQTPYYSFKGVPYAKPNVGPNKFRISEPAEPWTDVYDATNTKSTCVFFCVMRKEIVGDEDCLHLNVYTPTLDTNARKAVMVFFHGGGFGAGSGDDSFYGPDYLVDDDVILVSVNYRLGAVGYINTLDSNAPGNAGLKDQVLALKWVQENIQKFGGCPKRVTIFGGSAGAASVQFHMMSTMSKDLYSRAIMQSGSAISPWAIDYTPKENAFKLGELLGIKTSDTAELMNKLKEVSTKDIVLASMEIAMNTMSGRGSVFLPSVEADNGDQTFLPVHPWELIKSQKLNDVKQIIGVNRDESIFLANLMMPHADSLNAHFDQFIPQDLNITDPGKLAEISNMMKKWYLDGKPISQDTFDETVKMMSDTMFNVGSIILSKVIASQNKEPVYQYLFDYESPMGFFKNVFQYTKGVAHADELGYMFYSNFYDNKFTDGSPGKKLQHIITKYWTNFAKDGNPSSALDNEVNLNWEPLTNNGFYADLSPDLKAGHDLFKERIAFWADIYKDILGDYYEKLFK